MGCVYSKGHPRATPPPDTYDADISGIAQQPPPKRRNAVTNLPDFHNPGAMLQMQNKNAGSGPNSRWRPPMIDEQNVMCDADFLAKITAKLGL